MPGALERGFHTRWLRVPSLFRYCTVGFIDIDMDKWTKQMTHLGYLRSKIILVARARDALVRIRPHAFGVTIRKQAQTCGNIPRCVGGKRAITSISVQLSVKGLECAAAVDRHGHA